MDGTCSTHREKRTNLQSKSLKGIYFSGDLGIDVKIILKLIVMKHGMSV
jgi:hypothetical protein